MKQFTRRVRQIRRAFFDSRTIVASVGIVLSVVLHEAFHVLVHWGNITSVEFFPDSHAIMAITATTQQGYDVHLEEGIAYMITFATLVVTAMVVSRLSDRKDGRTVAQMMIPRYSTLNKITQKEFFELATRIKLL